MDHPVTTRYRLAQAVIALIILANVVVALGMVFWADSSAFAALNGNTVFLFAGVELLVLLTAYLGAKYEPIPLPGQNPG